MGSRFKRGETMKRKYEHRPGLFGLASIAAGCAAKDGEARTQRDSTATHGNSQIQTESRSESRKRKISDQSSGSVSGTRQ
jgi:hypothetical protein